MEYKLDAARAADLPALVELLGDLFGTELDFTADASRQERGLKSLLEMCGKGRAIIAVARDADGRAIGMVTAQLVMSTSEGAPSAWVEDVVVHRDHRRQGLGRRLLEYVLDWSRKQGATRAQLVADRENAPAELFYNALDWQATQLTVRRTFLEKK